MSEVTKGVQTKSDTENQDGSSETKKFGDSDTIRLDNTDRSLVAIRQLARLVLNPAQYCPRPHPLAEVRD